MRTLLALFATHFLADFLLQSREMGKLKSKEPVWLFGHLIIQLVCFLPFGWKLSLINAVVHGVIDWNIWRLYHVSVTARLYDNYGNKYVPGKSTSGPNHSLISDAKEWRYWEDHLFYTTIGLDQLLHISTLTVLGLTYAN